MVIHLTSTRKSLPGISLLLCSILMAACGGPATLTPTSPPAQAGSDLGQVGQTINEMMQRYDVPGAAVGLIRDGAVIYTKGYGVRNTQIGEPVTENTLFAIGSITKSFTSLGVLQQVDAGKLGLDAPVVKYVPDFKLSDPQATKQLTLRHLLSHTSGVPPFDDWYATPATSRKQILEDMAREPLTAPPGKLYQYTNQNFVASAYVLEQITGQSWEAYTQEHIFDALGMKTANFDVSALQRAPDYASPHGLDVLTGVKPVPFFTSQVPVPAGPASSINASILDMEQYALFQLGDGTFGGKRVVSQSNLAAMHTRYISMSPALPTPSSAAGGGDTAGTPASNDELLPTGPGYALGWLTEEYRGHELVAHNGSVDGFYAYLTLVPSTRSGVILLTNVAYAGGPASFADVTRLRLVDWLLGLPSNPELIQAAERQNGYDAAGFEANLKAARGYKSDPASLESLAGDYDGAGGKVSVTTQDGKLYVQQSGQTLALELVPFEPGGFLVNGGVLSGTVVRFKIGEDGNITVYEGGMQVAQRKGTSTSRRYTDPSGHFTVEIPESLTLESERGATGDRVFYVAFKSTNPPGMFYLMITGAGSDSAAAITKRALTAIDGLSSGEAVDVRQIPVPQGQTWTQSTYELPDKQVLTALVTMQKDRAYMVVVRCKDADAQELTPVFNSILGSFEIHPQP